MAADEDLGTELRSAATSDDLSKLHKALKQKVDINSTNQVTLYSIFYPIIKFLTYIQFFATCYSGINLNFMNAHNFLYLHVYYDSIV